MVGTSAIMILLKAFAIVKSVLVSSNLIVYLSKCKIVTIGGPRSGSLNVEIEAAGPVLAAGFDVYP